jgi:hypothetical protein
VLTLQHGSYTIIIEDESPLLAAPQVDRPTANLIHRLDDGEAFWTQHRVTCRVDGRPDHACLLRTSRGSTSTVHAHSGIVHEERCVVAVSSLVVALRLPDLALLWVTEADPSACFGVYHSASHASYLSHGELEVARIRYDGAIVWSCGGPDIFSNGFTLSDSFAEVIDFNNDVYRIDLATGHMTLL